MVDDRSSTHRCVTPVLHEHPQVYRASYSLTLPTTPRYKAEYGKPFAPVYDRSRKRHQYVLLPGKVCSAFYNVLLPGIVCSVIDRTLFPGLIQLGYRSLLPGIVCSGIYRLLPGSIQLGYLQSTSGFDTARVSTVYFWAQYSSSYLHSTFGLGTARSLLLRRTLQPVLSSGSGH
ncbi:hypothetical protein DPMN_161288 [Dreissena polymorpha]|uniref:Uncharacterized protein n=1 Tax=Dreissena polymorpha TaxID=45954 RepID=A0A9D4IPJ0_DREPO|nr:hypothetical protein DPMN_161288 [Dreissena polymorpha]